jgi:integrase
MSIKQFLRWCVGRAVLDQSPAEGIPLPAKTTARDRVLDDDELARVIVAARQIGDPYGGIVELLALTGQRREEVAQLTWEEIDFSQRIWTIPKSRTKNGQGACRASVRPSPGLAQSPGSTRAIHIFLAGPQALPRL